MVAARESITAKLCSFARAQHSMRRQKIFDDYLAFDLMGKEEYERIGQLIENNFELDKDDINFTFHGEKIRPVLDRYISPIPLSRIAFAEKKLLEFVEKNEICQYVICGAGMDTFAFRNGNSNIKIFEIDHPDTGRYKRERIRQLEWNIPKNLTFVPVDFEKDDMVEVLLDAGFDPEVPSFFAILGVTYYLTLPVFEQTIEKMGRIAAAGSELVIDYPDETTLSASGTERMQTLLRITEKLGEQMLHGYTDEEIFYSLGKYGFAVEEHETPQMIEQNYFSNQNGKMKAFENINFLLAVKEDE